MDIRQPTYFSDFQCLAGDCPHTCCTGWEVPIDPQTAQLYQTLPGPLGDRLRRLLETDGQGESVFRLRGEFCPFLTDEKLCEIHLALGQEATGEICRSHPRFSYDFGALREVGLCASCPAVTRLVLETEPGFTLSEDTVPAGEAPALLSPLLLAREVAMELVLDREFPLGQRLQALLLFANEVQVLLDQGQPETVPQLCQVYQEGFPLLEGEDLPPGEEALEKCLKALLDLEILEPQWRDLLLAGRSRCGAPAPPPAVMGERAAVYFLYRHWFRGVWDGDVLSWAEFTVLSTVLSGLLAPLLEEGFPGAFRLLCLELEHSPGNLAALQDWFCQSVSLPELLAVAQI